LSQKTRDLEAARGEDFMILACTVLTQYSSVTNGQTLRPWLKHAKHSAITRKKEISHVKLRSLHGSSSTFLVKTKRISTQQKLSRWPALINSQHL